MKQFLLCIVAIGGLMLAGCEETDVGLAIEAGKDAVNAGHPAPEARAQRMRAADDDPHAVEGPSILGRLWAWLKGLWPFGSREQS